LITFEDDGKIIISEALAEEEYKKLNISKNTRISLYEENKKYLEWHRRHEFKKYQLKISTD
jgi:putative restriction endonuclease